MRGLIRRRKPKVREQSGETVKVRAVFCWGPSIYVRLFYFLLGDEGSELTTFLMIIDSMS